ncbi:MAG: gliding motility-associated C-terminal domain-containing protein [Aureispira sp.]|nr:gliding motility-associated C-terminal domain-containing protein [Aureispira sp.]
MDSINYQLLSAISNNTSIEWSFEGGLPTTSTQANPSIYYPDTGSFSVQLILSRDGCSDTLTHPNFIQIKAAPIANFGITMPDSCAPVLVQFTDSSTSAQGNIQSWSWDLGNNQTANSSDTSLFYAQVDTFPIQLIVENNFGCKDTFLQVFSTYPSPIVDAGAYPSICAGDTLQLQGTATGNFTWSSTTWISDSSLLNPLTVLDSTQIYTLTSSNLFACTAIDSILITATPTTFVDAGNNINICLGDSILLQATGNANAYDWGINSSLSCQFCATPIAFPNTNTTYYLQPNVSSACSNIDSIIIYVHPLPIAQVFVDTLLCAGDTLQLNASGGQSYTWTAGLALSDSSIANPFALPTFSSTYTVVVLDSNNCFDSASIFVTISNPSFTPLPDQTICLGDSALLSLPNGINPLWSGDSLSCFNCLQTLAYPSDSNSYQVAYYDNNNCLIRDSLQIQVLDLSQLEALGSDTICLGDTIQLTVSGNNNAPIQWVPNYALSNNNSFNPLAYPSVDTQYIVQIRQGTCLANDTVNIYLRPSTEINATDISYCIGDSAQLMATGNSSNYNWSPSLSLSNSTIQNPIVTTSNNQIYQVVGTGFCNTDTAYANVLVYDYPNIQLDRSINAVLGSTIILNVNSNSSPNFDWSPATDLSCNNCPNPSWIVSQNQTFYVTATNSFGCPVLDSISVRFISDCTPGLVFVPNAFTPDSDGYNDILYAQSGVVQEIENFQIYSRWGELLFETDDLLEGWDGSFKGKAVAPDVFGYFLIFKCPNTGEEMLKKGNITILR